MNLKKFNLDYYFPMLFNKTIKNLVFIIGAISLSSCNSALYNPNSENTMADVNLEDLIKGRNIYIDKCAGCHNLILPKKYNNVQWIANLNKMQPKAKISNNEKKLIFDYLTGFKK